MSSQETHKNSSDFKYLSKRVLVNGQFVTLYSLNGQTWLSSPEEIPELMARLDNARIVLSNGEKPEDGEAQKAPKPAESSQESAAPVKLAANKYRMKGPKPRPILKQDGVVITGTPVEPISASTTVMKVSATEESAPAKVSPKGKKVAAVKAQAPTKLPAAAVKGAAKAKVIAGKSQKAPGAAKPLPVASAKKGAPAKTPVVVKASAAKKVEPKGKAKTPAKAAPKASASKPAAANKKKAAASPKKAKSTRK
jgi:hypothetical protein